MIQANELRIGNYIKDRGGKIWRIACWEYYDKVSSATPIIKNCDFSKKPIFGHPLTEYIEYLQPIPLSEEILLKCGFEYKFPFGYKIKQGCFIKDDLEYSGYYFKWNGQKLAFINYLHQLQNLYFALTNQELNIEL